MFCHQNSLKFKAGSEIDFKRTPELNLFHKHIPEFRIQEVNLITQSKYNTEQKAKSNETEIEAIQRKFTSNGDVRDPMLAGNINGVRENPVQRLRDHRKISGVLKKLKSRRIYIEAVLEEEVNRHPWEATETLNPISQSENLPDRIISIGFGHNRG